LRDLQHNAQLLAADRIDIRHADALKFLEANSQSFDVIFIDPPFHKGWLEKLLPRLAACLAPDGLVYVEAENPLADTPDWELLKSGKAGNVHYHLLSLIK
jgi:16S rRNA (guanine966-N2)-methyltransferase